MRNEITLCKRFCIQFPEDFEPVYNYEKEWKNFIFISDIVDIILLDQNYRGHYQLQSLELANIGKSNKIEIRNLENAADKEMKAIVQ
ncbi:hypothetical protein [Metallosphaera hakonensis]|uniref:hypothetical protein n=1 Tax=Metallosphaera hakonensis TaxID=79601 RepID=UPI0011B1D830|nr:hypothetical protein [Metallosphaera hakonensis]